MKLLRYGPIDQEKPGLLDHQGQIRDLSGIIDDINGKNLNSQTLAKIQELDPVTLPLVEGTPRIGPCITNVGKVICIGLNYHDHAKEVGAKPTPEPRIFMKATSSISGPYDDVEIPRGSEKTDWEVELGVVIGKKAKYIEIDQAMDYVAGYCLANDVSERDFQMHRSGQWVKGKSHDTFCPLGPWLVSQDEIKDPHQLSIWLEVDGKRYQDSSTSNLVHRIPETIAHLSHFMTLLPGDVILTGTPSGVGMGIKPDPLFLKPGMTMELGIEGLGTQKQLAVLA
ncbi:2-hydroxyhepta-2,4-diene-1,7-dioate isomerase [Kiloniella litopenaei]|uniref:2-hydroxyhepta-2,4-diene-1,7-dioate isomerase n=1 Tax=Kiloniella litopenaei TaxID=1549748 RepID=A0A0M2RET4_9PROT|nr:fumarylacetoacetate hydrolase family protein [Kiloniella litopenaei]KKJ78083.1 2-hydroxyhepta-2,4-diene-1,7-dioate isomerase [Kiloniella litopenaei]